MKKTTLMIVVVCAALLVGGADCESERPRLTPADIQALAAQQELLQQQVETLQTAATQITDDLADAGIVDKAVVAKIAKINEEADRIQAQMAVIAQGLEGVPLTGDTAQDFIAQLQAANVATGQTGLNPYAVPIGAGLSGLSIFLAWLAKRKAAAAAVAKTETKAVQLKYQAHKQGVERTMKEVSASTDAKVKAVESQLYDNIGEARVNLSI